MFLKCLMSQDPSSFFTCQSRGFESFTRVSKKVPVSSWAAKLSHNDLVIVRTVANASVLQERKNLVYHRESKQTKKTRPVDETLVCGVFLSQAFYDGFS